MRSVRIASSLLPEGGDVAERALERGERGAELEELLSSGICCATASGPKSDSFLNFSVTVSSAPSFSASTSGT